jgi:hypothetical protein
VGGFFMTGSEISETPHELFQKRNGFPLITALFRLIDEERKNT